MNDEQPEAPTLTVGLVAMFYGAMALVTLGIAAFFEIDVWTWHNRFETTSVIDLAIGATFGLVVVVSSAYFTSRIQWMADLSQSFRDILGQKTLGEVAVFAVASGVGEELLFRGLIQQALSEVTWFGEPSAVFGLVVSSILFGALHVGPDKRKFLPWTISAVVLGFAIGGIYLYTGNILAPIVAHFTINFFNLQLICNPEAEID